MATVTDWTRYAPYFYEYEFRCRHTGKCLMDRRFMDKLLAVRLEYNKPMLITSGYRDPAHPTEAAKENPGEHTLGLAADVGVMGAEALQIVFLAVKHGIPRVGVQQKGTKRFIHLGGSMADPRFSSPWIYSYT